MTFLGSENLLNTLGIPKRATMKEMNE